jgi:hypothetical protein
LIQTNEKQWEEAFDRMMDISHAYLSHEDRKVRNMAVMISSMQSYKEELKKLFLKDLNDIQ